MSIGILSIATNHYLNYWMSMVESFKECFPGHDTHTFYVFTEQTEEVDLFQRKHPDLNITAVKIDRLKFPEASLLRYEIYYQFKDLIVEDVLMHLDADMLIRDPKFIQLETAANLGPRAIALVSHPGYWRPAGMKRVKLNLTNPKILLRDIHLSIKYGGVGSWEADRTSSAYVPRNRRNNYVCGGIWVARNTEFQKLCKELSLLTRVDLEMGKIPIWHDESFLNLWASTNKFRLLSPSFCYDPRYPQLESLDNIVEAVDKNA